MDVAPSSELAEVSDADIQQHPLKRGIWAIANLMRSAGLSALDTIEHLTFLLFLQLVHEDPPDELADLGKISSRLKIDEPLLACLGARDPAAQFNDRIFPAFRTAVEEAVPSGDPLRAITDGFQPKIEDGPIFVQVLELAAGLRLDPGDRDLNGAIYEQLVATLSEAGHLGQYFTPRHIVDAMVELVDPQPGETVYDPAAGTGGFLLGAAAWERQKGPTNGALHLHGRELNRTVRRLCVMNLLTHGLSPCGVLGGDTLAPSNQLREAHDIVLTNPPFGGIVAQNGGQGAFAVVARSSEALFLQHAVAALRPGGRAAIVCPEGLLANFGPEREVRNHLMEQARIEAVASLPAGVFNPYTSVRTGVVVARKGSPTKKVWFFDVRADGFDLDMRRRPNGRSDIPDMLRGFSAKQAGPQSALVARDQLAADNDRLVASRHLRASTGGTSPIFRPLEDACVVRKSAIRPTESPDEEFFYIALEHIESETGRLLAPTATRGREIRSAKTRFLSGDVLYGKLRPYLAKAALMVQEGICSTELVVLQPVDDLILGAFLAEVLRSPSVTEEATALMVGANHPRIHPRDLLGINIPVPPMDAQQAFVREVAAEQERIEEAHREIRQREHNLKTRVAAFWA